MKVQRLVWNPQSGRWNDDSKGVLENAQLVFLFSDRSILEQGAAVPALRELLPSADLLGCSSAGEIDGIRVTEGTAIATAVRFDSTSLRLAREMDVTPTQSRAAGRRLAAALTGPGLLHVFILSDGLSVNGSELVTGLHEGLPASVAVTGGLSGDGERFERTWVCCTDPSTGKDLVAQRMVAAVGFYGDRLKISYGSLGGWDPFGPDRVVTRAEGAVLYELDEQPALELYRRYLGPHSENLPASALLFPLSLRVEGHDTPVVRTILGVDESRQSLTFAGDMPVGSRAQLMRANFDRLIDGAVGAAKASSEGLNGCRPDLAVLISCVGRKLVLRQRIEEGK